MVPTLHCQPLFNPPFSSRYSVDLKANGEVSRMRSHKGNMPSLPQTKYCSLCPAKFTRTTHLNRHLRSHTNERLHHCNTCSSQFTRSDLLTRHKRTCGDPMNVSRSRRKSCQSCAESKIKCDLQYPCSKCSARGRQCVFINNPEASRIRKFVTSQKSPRQRQASKSLTSNTSSPSRSPIPSSAFVSPALSFASTTSSLELPITLPSPPIAIRQHHVPPKSQNFGTANSSGASSLSSTFDFLNSSGSPSSDDSPGSDFFDNDTAFTFPVDFEVDSKSFVNATQEPFLDKIFPSLAEDPNSVIPLDAAFLPDPCTFAYPSSYDDMTAFPPLTTFPLPPLNPVNPTFLTSSSPVSENHQLATPFPVQSASSVTDKASDADLQHYLLLFFAAFSRQLPLIHAATWHQEGKPLVLLRAMQACGALLVNTRTAEKFISDTLFSTREALAQIVAKNLSNWTEQMHIILALVLLQTILLFRRESDKDGAVLSTIYHTLLITMIRRSALVYHVASWVPPDFSDPSSIELVWRDWANHETFKRALFLSYLQDCYHCMYFSTPSSFQPSDFNINLPCDDILWHADNCGAWFDAVYAPSPYGNGTTRLIGVDMESALVSLGQVGLSDNLTSHNPFANFLRVHCLLKSSFAPYLPKSDIASLHRTLPMISCFHRQNGVANNLPAQYALHNWLQAWLACPFHTSFSKGAGTPFVLNVLPFHWLLQASLLARHAGGLISGPGNVVPGCAVIVLVSRWLNQVRDSLYKGELISSYNWVEFGKLRMLISQVDFESVDRDGLLAFLPND